MKIDFTGRTALVTGGSRGIGRQIARDLGSCGARLIVTSTGPAPSGLIEELGRETRHMQADFSDAASRARFIAEMKALPELHVVVNNAGVARHGPQETARETDWDVTHDVNLKTPFLVTRAAAEIMKRQRYGRIVNITSIWGHISMAERSLYTATKFGLRGLTTAQALELARHDVLVNAVAPGFTLTDMVRRNYPAERLRELTARVPVGRLATTEDISRAVLFLASELNSYITGQSLVVDGGYSIA